MSWDEIFSAGAGHAREQEALDRVLPATEVVGEAPPLTGPADGEGDDAGGGVCIPPIGALAPFEPRRKSIR